MHTDSTFINITTGDKEGFHKYKCEFGNVTLKSLVRDDLLQGNPEGTLSGFAEYGINGDKGKKLTTDLQFADGSWSDLKFNKITMTGYFLSDSPGDYNIDFHVFFV